MTTPPLIQQGPTAASRRLILGMIVLGFLVVRLPMVLRLPGGQDECWYAVPGETVAREGIPRIPYFPARNPQTFFYHVDESLFTLPPALHYLQAPFFLVFPPGYATARLPALFSAALSIVLVYALAVRLLNDATAGLWAAGLYSLSRVLYFPALLARPDALCAACGLAALWAMAVFSQTGRLRWLIGSGLLTGLGALSHPFAIVFGIQLGVWSLWIPGTAVQRLRRYVLWALPAGAVLALWLPLIAAHRDAFQHQFFNNVLQRSGPGLIARLLWPWPYAADQARLLLEQAGPLQTGLMLSGLAAAAVLWMSRRGTTPAAPVVLAASGLYLHVACQGPHVAKGYWCYTGALLFLCLGWVITVSGRMLMARGRAGLIGSWCGAVLLVALMAPGSGVRLWLALVGHWSDPLYDARRFAASLLDELPADARYIVGTEYVFDFYLSGRPTVLDMSPPLYYGIDAIDYDYLVVGQDGIDKDRAAEFNAEFVRAFGDRDDEFACYAEVYRRSANAPAGPWPYDASFEEAIPETAP